LALGLTLPKNAEIAAKMAMAESKADKNDADVKA
jgi:hypothetical protein